MDLGFHAGLMRTEGQLWLSSKGFDDGGSLSVGRARPVLSVR